MRSFAPSQPRPVTITIETLAMLPVPFDSVVAWIVNGAFWAVLAGVAVAGVDARVRRFVRRRRGAVGSALTLGAEENDDQLAAMVVGTLIEARLIHEACTGPAISLVTQVICDRKRAGDY